MKITKIKKANLPECARILESAYGCPPYNESFAGLTARQYIENKYKTCKNSSFVAFDENNKIIAFIFFSISAWSAGPQATLEEFAVDPDFQGIGIGKKLIARAHKYLDSLGIKSVMLWAKNNEHLIRFYTEQGYCLADDYVVMFKNFDNDPKPIPLTTPSP